MFRYSTIYINIVSFVISIVIFLIINLFFSNSYIIPFGSTFKVGFSVDNSNIQTDSSKISEEEQIEETKEQNVEQNIEETVQVGEWYLEIPSISLKANIKEGTTKEIMDDYIGHFEETSKDIGNVGLAAHNRGYKNNYFENLKKLKEGEKVYYQYQGVKREYEITKHKIIKDTDWTNLEETKENTITLITCVENQPEYRRCIQGVESSKGREDF